jgi:hypothetical protein
MVYCLLATAKKTGRKEIAKGDAERRKPQIAVR